MQDVKRKNEKKQIIFAVSGYKNTGKTTLIEQTIPILTSMGYRVAVIKHDGHDFESDVPGTDSYRHQKAGAYGTAVFSDHRFLITKEWEEPEPEILLQAFPEADIILIEGMKASDLPKYICEDATQRITPQELAELILRQ